MLTGTRLGNYIHRRHLTTLSRLNMTRPSYTVLADNSVLARPVLDDRQYRFLELAENSLRVLVISDESADRAGAALDVNVGAFADAQYGVSGLAHFCEHLLFMGTAKYPAENEYLSFLLKHLGHSNAYTAAEHTNYYFEVDLGHLEGALDRFAQFFVLPLFSKSCQDREIRAVDSENKKNLQNDLWRMYQLDKLTANPKHPYHGFSTGNLATLHDEPVARGLNVRDVLLKFYSEQYLANLMSLVVLGKEPLDQLTQWAIDKFSAVPNSALPKPNHGPEPLFTPELLHKITRAKPIMDSHKLELSFYVPDDMEAAWRCKPGQYFSHLVGHESRGLLCDFLKRRNWINSLSAGNMKVCQGALVFVIDLELTPEGLDHQDDIVAHAFEYLAMVRDDGPVQWVWDEISDMSKINFRFQQKLATSATVSRMANTLYKFAEIPHEHLLDHTVLREFDPAAIRRFGSFLVPENLRISVTSQRLQDLPDKEHWYGTEYLFGDIPASLAERIRSPARNKAFHLPEPNTFIPSDFTVHGQKAAAPLAHPYLLTDSAKHQTWFKQDDRFTVPKGHINLTIHAPPLGASCKSSVLGMLLSELLDDDMNDLKYYASIVGLKCSLMQYRDAFSVKLSGYNDKLPQLMELTLRHVISFQPKPDRFASIKYKITQQLKNFGYLTPYSQVGTRFLQLVNEKTYTNAEKLSVLDAVEFDEVAEFALSTLWADGVFVQTLVHGNFEYDRGRELSKLVEALFDQIPAIDSQVDKVHSATAFQSYQAEAGERLRLEVDLEDAQNVNSCIEYFIQVGKLGAALARLRVLTDLLGTIIHEPSFNQWRTKEQLGYVVFSGFKQSRTCFGLRVLVQSEKLCPYLEFRIEEFLRRFEQTVALYLDEAFDKFKAALKSKKLMKLKNLEEENTRFWNAINDGYFHFEQKQEDVEVLESITRSEFTDFYRQYICGDDSGRIAVHLKSQSVPDWADKVFTTAVHNFVFEHEVDIGNEQVEEILGESSDAETVFARIAGVAPGAALLKAEFLEYVAARCAEPVPGEYPKGQLFESEKAFQESHKKAGVPVPVKALEHYHLPKETHL